MLLLNATVRAPSNDKNIRHLNHCSPLLSRKAGDTQIWLDQSVSVRGLDRRADGRQSIPIRWWAQALYMSCQIADARIKRSQTAKVQFKQQHPCPATGARKGPCKGNFIDHIVPLACHGADAPSNMQWQTVADAKAKDKWEHRGCRK